MDEKRDARGMTEEEAIARYRSRNYPKPAMTADIAVFSKKEEKVYVLLIRRKGHPFLDCLALPGGFANENEPVEKTAERELEEETGAGGLQLHLTGIYSAPGRDPRGWVVSAAFAAVTKEKTLKVQAGDDAASAGWYQVSLEEGKLLIFSEEEKISGSELAFDHETILRDALFKMQMF